MEKKLYKIAEGKKLCGICNGLAEYFGIDVTLVRLLTVVFALCGPGVLCYIIAAIIMPEKNEAS